MHSSESAQKQAWRPRLVRSWRSRGYERHVRGLKRNRYRAARGALAEGIVAQGTARDGPEQVRFSRGDNKEKVSRNREARRSGTEGPRHINATPSRADLTRL